MPRTQPIRRRAEDLLVEGPTGDAGATYDTVPVRLQKEVLRKPMHVR
jgi:hypothetical protein